MTGTDENMELRGRFVVLCGGFPGGAHGPGLWDALEAMYQVPARGYHSLRHIGECLAVLDSCTEPVEDRAAVELALWVHDCVYDSKRHDNEERSAAVGEAFCAALGAGEERTRRVRELVMATKHTGAAPSGDAAVMVDIDLSSFAASWERSQEVVRGIRQEYAWVPAE
jgi:predicted metal-dependent HD superfamily phosphohydrolase